jgi:hypothetical protein
MQTYTISCDVGCSHCADLDRLAKLSGLNERVTPEYDLRAKYNAFNQSLFNGELPQDIKLTWFTSKKASGLATCKFIRDKGIVPGTLEIKISTLFKRSEESMDAIMIHEMIHTYFFIKQDWSQNHGPKFLAMARSLGEKVGFAIPVTDNASDLQLSDAKPKPVGVIFVHRVNGAMAMILTTPAVIENGGQTIYDYWRKRGHYASRITGFVVTDSEWTLLAAKYPLTRKADGKSIKLFGMPSAEVVKRITPETAHMYFNFEIKPQ